MISKYMHDKEFRIRFYLFLGILGLFIYPIIHANIFNIDDYGRALHGYIYMAEDVRVLAHFLFLFLNASSHILDFAPLTQIFSAIILGFSLSALSFRWQFNRLSAVLVLPLIVCSPCFLSNLSYRFDAIIMSLALACAIGAICTEKHWGRILFLIASLNFYQAATSSFLVLLCMGALFILEESGAGASFRYYIKGGFSLFVALVFHKIEAVAVSLYYSKEDPAILKYMHDHGRVTVKPTVIWHNFVRFFNKEFLEFGIHGGAFEHILGIALICGFVAVLVRITRKQGVKSLPLILFYLVISVISLSGLMILLESPVMGVRVLMGNGALLALGMGFLLGRDAVFNSRQRFAVLAVSWILGIQILFAFECGNALHAQAELDEYIAHQLVEDIYMMTKGHETYVRILPDKVMASYSKAIVRKHPIWFPEGGFAVYSVFYVEGFAAFLLEKEGLQETAGTIIDDASDLLLEEAKKIRASCHYDHMVARRFYNLYQLGGKMVVDFNRSCPLQ